MRLCNISPSRAISARDQVLLGNDGEELALAVKANLEEVATVENFVPQLRKQRLKKMSH